MNIIKKCALIISIKCKTNKHLSIFDYFFNNLYESIFKDFYTFHYFLTRYALTKNIKITNLLIKENSNFKNFSILTNSIYSVIFDINDNLNINEDTTTENTSKQNFFIINEYSFNPNNSEEENKNSKSHFKISANNINKDININMLLQTKYKHYNIVKLLLNDYRVDDSYSYIN